LSNPNWSYDWSTFYRPLTQVLSAEAVGDLNYTFTGKILANGGIPVTRVAFELSDDMLFQNATLHPATMLEGGSNFSVGLILEGGKLYYYRAGDNQRVRFDRHVAQEAKHPTKGETSGGGRQAYRQAVGELFLGSSTFRPYESGWVYHLELGWAYTHPDWTSGLWLWMENQDWLWTREGAYPYFWKYETG
jgi:hypothetical protein